MARLLSYFSFQGRTNRRRYWETAITIGVFFFLAALVFGVLSGIPMIGILFGILLIAIFVAGSLAALANSARRLHDRGKSAWWLLLFVGVPALLSALGELMSAGGEADAAGPAGLVALISLPFSIWGLVEMGFLKGKAGPNRFGEDPLPAPQESAFA